LEEASEARTAAWEAWLAAQVRYLELLREERERAQAGDDSELDR
jgi:hypothetical protein